MKEKDKSRMPEWAPKDAGDAFASRVVKGKATQAKVPSEAAAQTESDKPHPHSRPASAKPDLDALYKGILQGDRTYLSKAITLIESNSFKHFEPAQQLLQKLLPHSGHSLRIGITGTPGAGKSTFIETFGTWLIEQGHKVAVLAIDPSSTISKGSIMGDKTRMEKLSRSESSFIRPSPSSGVLGGVARKTRESMILCEAAGYDIILIETVGVGQSEVTVRSMVDIFLLLQITGAGDDLQGIKKGIMELADLILINKADGDNMLRAETVQGEVNQVLHYLQPATKGWTSKAIACSALTGFHLSDIWQEIVSFKQIVTSNGMWDLRRHNQLSEWMDTLFIEALSQTFFGNHELNEQYIAAKHAVMSGQVTPTATVKNLISSFNKRYQVTE